METGNVREIPACSTVPQPLCTSVTSRPAAQFHNHYARPWHTGLQYSSLTTMLPRTQQLCCSHRIFPTSCSILRNTNISQKYARLEVFTAVAIKNAVLWDVTPCSSCKNPRFFAACIGWQLLIMLFLAHRILSPWLWRRYVPPTRLFFQEPHGVTSQKTEFFYWCVTTFEQWQSCCVVLSFVLTYGDVTGPSQIRKEWTYTHTWNISKLGRTVTTLSPPVVLPVGGSLLRGMAAQFARNGTYLHP
jgi:hypothetical protein